MGLPDLQRQMHCQPDRCLALPGGQRTDPAAPERGGGPSGAEPRPVDPDPGRGEPPALHPAALARGETCPAAAELLGRLAAEADTPRSRAASQLAFALLCELAGADSAAPPLPPLVEAAIEDIRQNYAGLYGVEELSERLGVSKSHLVRTFTAAVGVPPGRYLTTVRVEAAMRLLLHREYTLDVIASLCGFSGANYLCRVFKKETGQSPAQWRALAGQTARPLSPAESQREQALYI